MCITIDYCNRLVFFFFFSSRRRHTRCSRDWSSDVCSSDLGMKKRVGIARAIAGKPKYLLYDEPTSGLDPVNADVIDGLVERLQDELGVTSVVVSHDVRGSFRVADRVALLWQGGDAGRGGRRESA